MLLGLHLLLLLHALETNMLLGLHLLLLHARMPRKASRCWGYIRGCICCCYMPCSWEES